MQWYKSNRDFSLKRKTTMTWEKCKQPQIMLERKLKREKCNISITRRALLLKAFSARLRLKCVQEQIQTRWKGDEGCLNKSLNEPCFTFMQLRIFCGKWGFEFCDYLMSMGVVNSNFAKLHVIKNTPISPAGT